VASDLREQVARRLWILDLAAMLGVTPNPKPDAWPNLCWEPERYRRAADECIRLMEWARGNHGLLDDLTLPPDEWQS